jgi:hypothetical protein
MDGWMDDRSQFLTMVVICLFWSDFDTSSREAGGGADRSYMVMLVRCAAPPHTTPLFPHHTRFVMVGLVVDGDRSVQSVWDEFY